MGIEAMEVFNELLEYLSKKEELVNEEISIMSSIVEGDYILLNGKRCTTILEHPTEENLILDKERLFERVYKELVKELKRREEK